MHSIEKVENIDKHEEEHLNYPLFPNSAMTRIDMLVHIVPDCALEQEMFVLFWIKPRSYCNLLSSFNYISWTCFHINK